MAKVEIWTLEEVQSKSVNEGGLEGLWWWGGEEVFTGIGKFDRAWQQFGEALETLDELLKDVSE